MTTLVLRNTKGSPLTFTELDNNFSNLNTDKLDVSSDNYVTTTTAGTVCTFSNVDAYPGRFDVTAASTGGWEAGAGHLQVEYNFTSSGYFSGIVSSGGGHMGCALRLDNSVIATHVRGHGHLIGLCTNGTQSSSDLLIPNGMIETWMGGLGASQPNIVYPGSEMPPGYKFEDGKNYKDRKWIRVRYYVKESSYITDTVEGTAGFWTMMWDTGYWLDTNPWADFTKTGIMFYEVFAPSGTWSITFSDLKVRWGPYLGQAEEATANRHYRNGTAMTYGLFPRSDSFGPTGVAGTFRTLTGPSGVMLTISRTRFQVR
jgi:hypothetical protein